MDIAAPARMLRHSLKVRLALLLGLAAVLTTLLLGQVASTLSRQQIRADKGTLLREVALQMANRLSQDMSGRAGEIRFLAALGPVRDPATPLAEKQALFDEMKRSHPFYAWIGMADPSGTIVAGTDGLLVGKSVAQRAWLIEGRKGLHFGNAHDAFLLAKLLPKPRWDDLPLRLVDVSAPVRDAAGTLVGVICGHLSLDWAFEARERMLANLSERGLDLVVLNADGRVLMGTPELPSLSLDLSRLGTFGISQLGEAAVQVETWPDGVDYLTAAVPDPGFREYPGMGWSVLAREPVAQAFAPARRLGYEVQALGLGFAVLLAALLWLILSRQLKPLERLSRAAERIRREDTSAPIPPVQGRDEIAVFARSLTALVEQLQERNAALRLTGRVFEESGQGIVITDPDNRILRVNRAFSRITGYAESEAIGQTPALLKSGRHDAAFYRDMWSSLAAAGIWRGEIWNRNKAGRIYPEWLTVTALRGDDGRISHHIGLFDDITEKKEYEQRLLHLANYDPLTDLPNRHLLERTVRTAMDQAHATGTGLAILFADLDQFSHINDTLGHPAGDRVLVEVARRFADRAGAGRILARWGGDELVLVLPGADSHAAARMAQGLIAAMAPPFFIAGTPYHLGASIGISMYPDDSDSVDGLLRCADTAMYQAKRQGKNGHAFYAAPMNARVERFLSIDNALRGATGRGEMSLVFQPQFDITGNGMVGAEALLRWHHPTLGDLSPGTFIPIAEETGQILALGQWVLAQAAEAFATIRARRGAPLALSVNLSARQLGDPRLDETIIALAQSQGVPPGLFKLEVTESAIMSDETTATKVLGRLRKHGFAISIDDFGTGYSCLHYINRIKPDEIKIDRSFIQTLSDNPDSRSIVRFTLGLARTMGVAVVAEGIETAEQLALLRSMGEMHLQGFLLARPMSLEDLAGRAGAQMQGAKEGAMA